MKKDSKYICQFCEARGIVIKTNYFTGEKKLSKNYFCWLKNICLNNVCCGICKTFKNVTEPEIEYSEFLNYVIK
jgi:hypothetical protein